MKKKLFCFTLIFALISVQFGGVVYADESGGSTAVPELGAKGACVIEMDTGRVLYEKEADTPLANASTTKIMTAIIVLENAALSDVVTASKNAAQTPPVKMYLEVGEKQTVEDLLFALMLESANDAAVALAEHVGGSVSGFAAMMNKKALSIGATDTEFVTPNGLDKDDHHTTARDLALIARYALKNDDFRRIIATKNVQTPYRGGNFKAHSFTNKDRLLYEYSGAIGIKTGYTGRAGHCFVGAATKENMTLISVVLASGWGAAGKEKKWTDTKRLLDYGFNNFKYTKIADAGKEIVTANVDNSKKSTVTLLLSKGLALPLSKDEAGNVDVKYNVPKVIDAPVAKGETLGGAEVYINGEMAYKIDIIADRDVARVDFQISARKVLDSWLNMRVGDL